MYEGCTKGPIVEFEHVLLQLSAETPHITHAGPEGLRRMPHCDIID